MKVWRIVESQEYLNCLDLYLLQMISNSAVVELKFSF